jgi:hypothetical protein
MRAGPPLASSWLRTAARGGGTRRRRVEAAVGGAWRRLSSPAPASRPASHKDPIAFFIFVLDPIAFYFLFRDLIVFYFLFWYMIAFLFYIQGPIYKKFDSQVI